LFLSLQTVPDETSQREAVDLVLILNLEQKSSHVGDWRRILRRQMADSQLYERILYN